MKRIFIVAVIGLGIVGGIYGLSQIGSTTTADNSATSTPSVLEEIITPMTPEEKMEEATQELIAAAIAASSTEIEAAKQEAADRVENSMEAEIEKEVRQGLINSNDAVIIEIEGKQSF